jgi:hypothetical protein
MDHPPLGPSEADPICFFSAQEAYISIRSSSSRLTAYAGIKHFEFSSTACALYLLTHALEWDIAIQF